MSSDIKKCCIKPAWRCILYTSFNPCFPKAIPHKERLATLHAICLQISLQSLFRIFPHASCVHIFRDISGKYSKIHKGFSPFFPSSLKKSDDAICIRQIRNRLSYFTKMLVNTSSIHSAFCFIWRKIWRRICRTIFVRYCHKSKSSKAKPTISDI